MSHTAGWSFTLSGGFDMPGPHPHTATRPCPALPLAPERTVPARSRPSGSLVRTATRPRACPDPGLALPLAPERTQAPPLHCHSAPSVPGPRSCTARWFLVTRSQKKGSRVGRIMNMLWLFSFSQSTCHKALPCISACDFCLWRDGRDAAQSYGVLAFAFWRPHARNGSWPEMPRSRGREANRRS